MFSQPASKARKVVQSMPHEHVITHWTSVQNKPSDFSSQIKEKHFSLKNFVKKFSLSPAATKRRTKPQRKREKRTEEKPKREKLIRTLNMIPQALALKFVINKISKQNVIFLAAN